MIEITAHDLEEAEKACEVGASITIDLTLKLVRAARSYLIEHLERRVAVLEDNNIQNLIAAMKRCGGPPHMDIDLEHSIIENTELQRLREFEFMYRSVSK